VIFGSPANRLFEGVRHPQHRASSKLLPTIIIPTGGPLAGSAGTLQAGWPVGMRKRGLTVGVRSMKIFERDRLPSRELDRGATRLDLIGAVVAREGVGSGCARTPGHGHRLIRLRLDITRPDVPIRTVFGWRIERRRGRRGSRRDAR